MSQELIQENPNLKRYSQAAIESEIDLKKLYSILWSGRWVILGVTVVVSTLSLVLVLTMPNIYRSEVLLAPAHEDKSGLSSLANQFGGLASLAGVSLGGGSADKTIMGLEVLKSRQFFERYLNKYDVLVPLMASDGWDQSDNSLIFDAGIYDVDSDTWVRESKPPRQAKPSLQEAHEKFLTMLSVIQSKDTGFVIISIEHYSPYVAQEWLVWLVDEINQTLRDKDVEQAENSIQYLKEQITETAFTELKAGFFELIQSQTKTIMLANASPAYLFKIIDPAVVPEVKSKPNRMVICVLGVFLGGVLGVFLVLLLRHTTKEE